MIRPFGYLVPLYRAAIGAKNAAYDRGSIHPQRLSWPVVSVGNLSVGGGGKTPLVIRLAQLLAAQHVPVGVLSRGYGRGGSEVERVDAGGDAAQFGDEPLLITRSAKVPVYLGTSRYEAGLLAERAARESGIHLLDDGFQHRKLARDMDVVVLHASDFEECLLPAGRLREPLTSLRRATVIVLRAEDRQLESELRKQGISAPVWIQHRQLTFECVTRAVAFCGIARPEEFFSALRSQKVNVSSKLALRDHQKYSDAHIERLVGMLHRDQAECFITTEKDAVRLTNAHRARLGQIAPLQVARLQVSLEDEDTVVRQLMSLIVRK